MSSDSLKPTARLPPSSRVHSTLIASPDSQKTWGPVDAGDLDDARLEGPSGDDDVTLVLEDPRDPVDHLGHVGRVVDGEDVVVLVLEVAGLVGPQSGGAPATGELSRPSVDTCVKSTTWLMRLPGWCGCGGNVRLRSTAAAGHD